MKHFSFDTANGGAILNEHKVIAAIQAEIMKYQEFKKTLDGFWPQEEDYNNGIIHGLNIALAIIATPAETFDSDEREGV